MTQSAAVLAYLKHRNTLTPLQALRLFGCWRLSGRILELRQAGYCIVTDMVRVGTKRVARYRMVV